MQRLQPTTLTPPKLVARIRALRDQASQQGNLLGRFMVTRQIDRLEQNWVSALKR